MPTLRAATLTDLDFLVRVDIDDEGVDPGYRDDWGEAEFLAHREMIRAFITDADKGAFVFWSDDDAPIGVGMWRFRNVLTEDMPSDSVFLQIDRALFPTDGSFCEIFQLWVDAGFRRQGLGTQMKRAAEADALGRGVTMIYTHTEEQNLHVLELNAKLGYTEVRRGPIWDDVIRVSLVKRLQP